MQSTGAISIDVEDWFHILDTAQSQTVSDWDKLESRIGRNMDVLLEIFDRYQVKATLFWLGWAAERNKDMLRRCVELGHEIASHGYAHLLAYQVGREAFREDITRAKKLLEDLTGVEVAGFRAPGFGITAEAAWAFDEIRQAGYSYDSSVFPAVRAHGGLPGFAVEPHVIETAHGGLPEFPVSVVELLGRRINLFGGGYLRLAPLELIHWAARRLALSGRPLIMYLHPREIDPDHPRLALGAVRNFKSYVNLHTTQAKLESLCASYEFCLIRDLAERLARVPETAGDPQHL